MGMYGLWVYGESGEMKYMVMSDWSCGRYKLVGIGMVDEMGNLKKS